MVNPRNTQRTRRGFVAVAALLATLVGGAVAATPASATQVGIVDFVYYTRNVAAETNSKPWKATNFQIARIAVPFDIATRPDNDPIRARFNYWLWGVVSSGASPYVTFTTVNPAYTNPGYTNPNFVDNWNAGVAHTAGSGHCFAYSNGEVHCNAPDLNTYSNAVAAFVKAYGSVKTIGAWNEPDYEYSPIANGGTGRRWYTPDNKSYLYQSACSTNDPNKCGPLLAAKYWTIVKFEMAAINRCGPPQCLTVAGEFTGATPNPDTNAPNSGYFEAYRFWLSSYLGQRPYIWAIHPYGEAARGDSLTTKKVLTDSRYLGPGSGAETTSELAGNPASHLWDSAAGVHYTGNEQAQADTLGKWITEVSKLNSSGSYTAGRVPRLYVYNWENTCVGCSSDTALVSPGSPDTPDNVHTRKAYSVVAWFVALYNR